MEKDSDYGWTETDEHAFRCRELAEKDAEIKQLNDRLIWWSDRAHEFEEIITKQDIEIERVKKDRDHHKRWRETREMQMEARQDELADQKRRITDAIMAMPWEYTEHLTNTRYIFVTKADVLAAIDKACEGE